MLSYVSEDTVMSFNQRTYINNYNKDTYKMFPFRVRKDDKQVIQKLSSVRNINKYIYTLIDNDINHSVLTIKQIKESIIPILNRHQIDEVYLFGSYARGEANNNSDIDIYCNSGDIKTLIEQHDLQDELEKVLNKKIDIVFIGSKMLPYFKEQLDKDKIRLCY